MTIRPLQIFFLCFVFFMSSDILWNCFQILWLALLKSTPEIYATLGPHSPGSRTCDGWLVFFGENQFSPGYFAITPIPARRNNVYNRICKYFCKKGKRKKNAVWHNQKKKMEKVVVAELCGLKCLNNCHPNILLFSRNTVLAPKYKIKYKDMYSKYFFPLFYCQLWQNKMM